MHVDARGRGALPWTPGRFQPVQRTGRQWMLVDGVISHRPLPKTTCAARRMIVDARGRGALPGTPGRFLPVQRSGRSCMHVDGVISHWRLGDS